MAKEEEILEELRRIRALLEPKPAPPPPQDLWTEFLDFISKHSQELSGEIRMDTKPVTVPSPGQKAAQLLAV